MMVRDKVNSTRFKIWLNARFSRVSYYNAEKKSSPKASLLAGVTETPQVASNAAIKYLPVGEDTVLKFEHRVFQRRGPFRTVPDIFNANHLLQEVAPQWTITDSLPVFRANADPAGLEALDPTLIQVGDFVDVSTTISITLNQRRQFYLSSSLLRVIQLTQAPTFNDDEEEEGAGNEEDEGAGPVLDFIPPSETSGDAEMAEVAPSA
ncbi:hypothetical protein FRC01_000955 [Tulasnella sp. 417]|nr:hypothetical protein FRC01_000955 [Tulasnella sp. 417]